MLISDVDVFKKKKKAVAVGSFRHENEFLAID